MSNIAKLKKKAADFEQKKQFDKALAVYVQILEQLDPREDEADVALYNRVGDLLIRQGNVPEALNHYEKAVDLYAEGGFFNNAIALCNKILRNAPGRSSIYYKLGKISAKKGFVSDAKQNFLEYADRMQKVGQTDEAFRALKEFADLCPDQDDIRLMLAEQLSKRERKGEALEQLQLLYEKLEAEGRSAEARATVERMKAIDPSAEPKSGGAQRKEKSSELVFLDVTYDEPPTTRGGSRPPSSVTPSEGVPPPTAGLPLIEPEPFADLEEEPDLPPVPGVTHGAEFDDSLADHASENGASGSMHDASVDFDPGHAPGVNGGGMIDLEDASYGIRERTYEDLPELGAPPGLDRMDSFDRPEHDLMLPGELPSLDAPGGAFGDMGTLDLSNNPFGSDLGAESLGLDDSSDTGERPSLGLDEDVPLILLDDGAESLAPPSGDQSTDPGNEFFGGDDAFAIGESAPDEEPALPGGGNDPLDELRGQLQFNEGNTDVRRQLAEALIERGDREEGLRELDLAMIALERAGDLDSAESVADEIIRLNPNSVRHHQKRVEYAFRTSDKPRLGEAYLELADALFRTGQGDKARAVYQRVLELAPDDVRAQAALSAFAQPLAAEPAPKKPGKENKDQSGIFRRYTAEEPPPVIKTASKAAPAAAPAQDDDSLVNLGDWLRADEEPRSTRMVVDERAPSGDEQADFSDMLRKFKQGVAQNIDEEDHESHYDLGVAYKEMGLLDDAIAEFQKALRGSHHRVRTYEALGQCFLEQSKFPVAATVLSRALAEDGHGDEQLVGVLYLLGYASEAMQQWDVALGCYQRVYAVDIGFRDVASRIETLQRVGT